MGVTMNRTKEDIFEAAIKVFSCNGYDRATMEDIASNAGVSKGTLYYHFKSKEEIFKYAILESMNFITNNMKKAINGKKDPLDRLISLYKNQVVILCENKDFFNVIMSQAWGHERRQKELKKIIESYIAAIQKSLKEAMDEGIIKKGETKFLAYTFFGVLCSGAVYELVNGNENSDIDNTVESMTKYVLHGIINM